MLKLGEGETLREKLEADGLVIDFVFELRQCFFYDFPVVKCQLRKFVYRAPERRFGKPCHRPYIVGFLNEGIIGHSNYTSLRVTIGAAKGVGLLEVDIFQSGQFVQNPFGCIIDIFLIAYQIAWDSFPCFEGRLVPFNQKDF